MKMTYEELCARPSSAGAVELSANHKTFGLTKSIHILYLYFFAMVFLAVGVIRETLVIGTSIQYCVLSLKEDFIDVFHCVELHSLRFRLIEAGRTGASEEDDDDDTHPDPRDPAACGSDAGPCGRCRRPRASRSAELLHSPAVACEAAMALHVCLQQSSAGTQTNTPVCPHTCPAGRPG